MLADHARSQLDPAPARLRGLGAASRALWDLHRVELPRADGACERLSHGDATLRNVLFDPGTGEARWFDFDTAHDPGLAPAWRHGDDLRALVYSAVESFADVPVALLLRTVQDAYADAGPWEQLRDRLARGCCTFRRCTSPRRVRPMGGGASSRRSWSEGLDGADHSWEMLMVGQPGQYAGHPCEQRLRNMTRVCGSWVCCTIQICRRARFMWELAR